MKISLTFAKVAFKSHKTKTAVRMFSKKWGYFDVELRIINLHREALIFAWMFWEHASVSCCHLTDGADRQVAAINTRPEYLMAL